MFSNAKQLSGSAKSALVLSGSVILTNEVMEHMEFCMKADDKRDRGSVFSFPVSKFFNNAYADFVLIFKILAINFCSVIQDRCIWT